MLVTSQLLNNQVRVAIAAFIFVTVLFVSARYRRQPREWQGSLKAGFRVQNLPQVEWARLGPPESTNSERTTQPPSLSSDHRIIIDSGYGVTLTNSRTADHLLADMESSQKDGKPRVNGVVVMGRLSTDNTAWVGERLPEWKHAIYTVDKPSGEFQTPMNKGKESMPYLTYLIDHYDNLPETIVFLHSHENGYPGGWHTDAPDHSNVWSVQHLNRNHVQERGYVNLRCIFIPGCPDEIQPFRDPPDYTDDKATERAMAQSWSELFNNTDVPKIIAVPCCAQFAVSREAVLKRSRHEYMHFRQWVIDFPGSDPGRILEYLWHIIFGMDPIACV